MRVTVALASAAAALVFGGCAAAGSPAADDAVTSAVPPPAPTYGTPAAQVAIAIGCTSSARPRPTPSSTGELITLPMLQPTDEVICRIDGQYLDVTTWPNAGKQSAAEYFAAQVLASAHTKEQIAAGDGWLVGTTHDPNAPTPSSTQTLAGGATLTTSGSPVQTAGQRLLLHTIAHRLHASVLTIG